MTIQLIGKDDGNFDDTEVLTGRWQSYIDAFVSVSLQRLLTPNKLLTVFFRERQLKVFLKGG